MQRKKPAAAVVPGGAERAALDGGRPRPSFPRARTMGLANPIAGSYDGRGVACLGGCMADESSLELIGKVVLESREEMRAVRGELGGLRGETAAVRAELAGMRDDQTVMIRMLQRREAELDLMRALEQRYQPLRAKVEQLEQRLDRAGIDRQHPS
jgi:hypothetical protein